MSVKISKKTDFVSNFVFNNATHLSFSSRSKFQKKKKKKKRKCDSTFQKTTELMLKIIGQNGCFLTCHKSMM